MTCMKKMAEMNVDELLKFISTAGGTITSDAIGVDLETCMTKNIEKLKVRYPDGFSTEASLHRKEGDI